jgi:hypothetical protein
MDTSQDRHVLESVPRLHFYEGGPACPEDIPFPSAMRALMEFLREEDLGCRTCRALQPGCKVACSYAFFIGVSGVASYLNWKPGWAGDNQEIMYMSDDPLAPFRRAFEAAGWGYRYLGHEQGVGEDTMRKEIVESIQGGVPVLAFGPIGPPESALVCGYDDGGDVLVGWSFFQGMPPFNAGVELDANGMFRASDWFSYPPGFSIMLVGGKKDRAPLGETYRDALAWMLQVARTPLTFGDRRNGLAAYGAWAAQVGCDEDFRADEALLRERHDVHNGVVGTLAEARWYGMQFLLQAGSGEILPYRAAAELLHAAACYAEIHALMWRVWDLAGGNGNPDAWRLFARPEARQRIAAVLREACRQDEMAVGSIERALKKM